MKRQPSYQDLLKENADLRGRVQALEAEVAELKRLIEGLTRDSRTSHKPPSQDKKRYSKLKLKDIDPSSARKERVKETLNYSEMPDSVERCELSEEQCSCGARLAEVASHWERVQVYELPELKMTVNEYQRERKRCLCGKLHEAALPAGIRSGVQYGAGVKGLMSYLHQYQHLPLGRCVESLADMFGHRPCEKTLLNAQQTLYTQLEDAEQLIIEGLKQSPTLHADETGIFVEGKNHWLHVRSNASLTYYHIHASRGAKAHQSMAILNDYRGRMVHDCYSSYFKHQAQHVLCHAHTIRELFAVFEQDGQNWAYELAHHLVAAYRERGSQGLSLERQADIETAYLRLLKQGQSLNPQQPRPLGHRGRVKQTKAFNLLQRLHDHQAAALAFIRDPTIPFTNNQAERDLRMTKLKQKISGGFQTQQSPKLFCRIRGYISTLRKQNIPVLNSLSSAFRGQLVLPCIEPLLL